MKKLWRKILDFMKRLYKGLVDETKVFVPISIDIVEALKKVLESQADDIILEVLKVVAPKLPTNKINLVKNKVEAYLPKLLLELNLINSVANTTNVNEQLKLVLEALKLSTDEVKNEKYHALASRLLVILSDGKVTWGESVMFTEWYYQTYIKKND